MGAGLLSGTLPAFGQEHESGDENGRLTRGDAAVLRFLAAAELIETDLWQQYNELAGVNGGSQPYIDKLAKLDADMSQYITDNTDDEMSHAAFLNGYLVSKGEEPVNLDKFRTLPSSKATGAQQIGRLTNLMQLTVDTSWWTRYRSKKNPDFGATFPQAIPSLHVGKHPAIPRTDADLGPSDHIQAIANTAGFHFAFIEQGGSSLYTTVAQKMSSLEALRIVVSIGGTEVAHFQTWHDKAGNIVPLTDPNDSSLVFPDLNAPPFGGEKFQTNLIMPEPCEFINKNLPACSIIRPTATRGVALGAFQAFFDDGLFIGQSRGFFAEILNLAYAADKATRTV